MNYKPIIKYLTSVNSILPKIENTFYNKLMLFNFLLNKPVIINYINNYMNHKFKFDIYNIDDFLYSFNLILTKNNITFLNFPKFKRSLRYDFKNNINENTGLDLSEFELNELYRLNKVINIEVKSIDIKKKNLIDRYILEECNTCVYQQKNRIFLKDEIDKLDVLIIYEKKSKHFKFLIDILKKHNLKYILLNVNICNNKKITNCSHVFQYIQSQFNPKYKILITRKINNNLDSTFINFSNENIINNINSFNEKLQEGKINKNLSLFDIKKINNNLLYIFINENNKKIYKLVENPTFDIFIKNGTFQQCSFLSSDVDLVTKLTLDQKNHLLSILRIQMNNVFNN